MTCSHPLVISSSYRKRYILLSTAKFVKPLGAIGDLTYSWDIYVSGDLSWFTNVDPYGWSVGVHVNTRNQMFGLEILTEVCQKSGSRVLKIWTLRDFYPSPKSGIFMEHWRSSLMIRLKWYNFIILIHIPNSSEQISNF